MVGRAVKGDIHAGEFAHDGGEALDGERHGAGLLDLGLDLAADAEVKVGGGQRNVVLFRLDQHVAEDGHGGFGANDVEDLASPLLK